MVALALPPTEPSSPSPPASPVLEVVIPVYNEQRVLERSVRRLRSFLDDEMPWPAVVTIVDNGSTDNTAEVAAYLAARLPGVRCWRLTEKGRGLALRTAWGASEAAVVAYMDVDLSTDLRALLPLVAPLVSGHSDVAIGTRLARGARVVRGPQRELVSRTYNLILKACLRNGFSDAQCGFKAARTEVVRRLLPDVSDNQWFFDTELLVLAERSTLRIHEVPVDWVDDPDSRVHLVQTATDDLRGVVRLVRHPHRVVLDQEAPSAAPVGAEVATRFAKVGVVSTVAYLSLFFWLRGPLGSYGANTLALGACTLANALANARFTFAARRPLHRVRLVAAGLAALVASLAATSAALGILQALNLWRPAAVVGVVLVVANLAAAAVRFTLLHAWMFGHSSTDETKEVPA